MALVEWPQGTANNSLHLNAQCPQGTAIAIHYIEIHSALGELLIIPYIEMQQVPYMAAYSTLLFFFFEPVIGLVRTIHRCVQYIDFAEIFDK